MAGDGSYVNVSEKNFHINTPFSIVRDQFANAQTFAESARNRTDTYLDALQEALNNLELPDTSDITAVEIPEVDDLIISERPDLSDFDIDTTIPSLNVVKPTLIDLPEIPVLDIEAFPFSIPSWSEIEKPTLSDAEAPSTDVDLLDVNVPSAPELTLPSPPSLSDIQIPGPPEYLVEPFEGTLAPFEYASVPREMAFTPGTYDSDIWQTLMAKILNDLINGGTGLPEDVELGIWNRAVERAQEEYTTALREAEALLGQNGLGLPSGAYTSALMALEADWSNKLTNLGYTISEEQAKLAQTNSQFIVEQGLKCEEMLRTFFNAQEDRILDAEYKAVSTAIEVYKAFQQEHNNLVAQFEAEVRAYEAKMKTLELNLEGYKYSIEGAKVSAETQALLVEMYTKQMAAIETRVRLFVAELEAAGTYVNINGQKLTALKTAIEAYSARLSADKLQYDIYNAEQAGEQAKADIFKSQAQAYESMVTASVKRQEAYSDRSEAITKQNEVLISEYRAELQAFEVETNAIQKSIEAKVDGYRVEATAYSAETQGLTAYYAAKEAQSKLLIERANVTLQQAIAAIKAVTDSYVSLNSLKVEGLKGTANVSAQLTASALSGIHASSSVGYSSGESMTESWSHGDSISETHSFDEVPTPAS